MNRVNGALLLLNSHLEEINVAKSLTRALQTPPSTTPQPSPCLFSAFAGMAPWAAWLK
jgi:hypothetical protein